MSKVLFLVSPALNSFVDPKKGTTGNKIDCAMKHFANSQISNATVAALGGVTMLAGKAVLAKAGTSLADMGTLKKAWTMLKAAPTPVKVITGALAGLSLLVRTYKAGVIEQKYIDRAQFVDHTFTDDEPRKASTPIKK